MGTIRMRRRKSRGEGWSLSISTSPMTSRLLRVHASDCTHSPTPYTLLGHRQTTRSVLISSMMFFELSGHGRLTTWTCLVTPPHVQVRRPLEDEIVRRWMWIEISNWKEMYFIDVLETMLSSPGPTVLLPNATISASMETATV